MDIDLNLPFVASVAVEGCLYPFDRLYDYLVPDILEKNIRIGISVMVPFGRGNKKRIALVYDLKRKECDLSKIKPITEISSNGAALNAEQLELSVWLKENTFCTFFDAIRTILPPGLNFGIHTSYYIDNNAINFNELSEDETDILNVLMTVKSEKSLTHLIEEKSFGEKAKALDSLKNKGIIIKNEEMKRHIGDETEHMVRLCADFEKNDRSAKLTSKQKTVIKTLTEYESASVKELCYLCGVTSAVIKNLVKYKLLEEYTYTISRADLSEEEHKKIPDDIILSESQQKAYDRLKALMNEEKPNCALLYGVTGSGKTSVFVKLIDTAIKNGRTALMLVPEISLTPQIVKKFKELFSNTVAIVHSGLSMGRRADEYRRIKDGGAKIVIGTRSAIFAPLDNIGIIIIDEEGEHTYKSDRSPRYHARNAAKQRCFKHNSLLLLASATPSPESMYYAVNGKYTLVELSQRYNRSELPEVFTVDMKAEYENGNRGNFSAALLNEIELNLQRGEQTLLLLNRRGYYTHMSCIKCGRVMECPECQIPLTYHIVNDSLCCHYCGYLLKMPKICPECGSKYITQSGTGTQRIEDEINRYFPTAKILRIDADTTMSANAFTNRFEEFGRGEYDIMVGTQMIAKGLDFENVTLVGVLSIDKSLYAGDYLGYERTFSLITQVVGRSGRGGKTGRAYLQTFSPDHYVLKLAARQDYNEFYAQEIEARRALLFPPFCDICLIGFSSLLEQPCVEAAKRFLDIFKERMNEERNRDENKGNKPMPIRILGPTKMGTGRLGGRFRNKIIIKCRFNKRFRALLNDVLLIAYGDKAFLNVSFFVDINGEIQ